MTEASQIVTSSKEKEIWDLSNEELFNQIDSHYDIIIKLDKQQVHNDKSLNQNIRDLVLKNEELWKRGQVPFNLDDICNVITNHLAQKGASKNIRIIVARQLDSRFKRKYNKSVTDEGNVTTVTIDEVQSSTLFERIKSDITYVNSLNYDTLLASDVQDINELLSKAKNKCDKYCNENQINTIDLAGSESELDRLRRNAKGKPIPCPTPEGIDQRRIKSDNKSDQEILNSLRTEKAKAIFRYSITWREIAFNADNHPSTLEGDDEMIAKAFNSHREFLECYNDIKIKRDKAQWCEIIDKYKEISKHNAASNETLNVFGVSCQNCGARMKPIDKKRDLYRHYWRCPNYYRTEEEFIGCKNDMPIHRSISKERITEIEKLIIRWATDVWESMPTYLAFLYDFRNYKQPYHTEHTKLLEPKFQRRGV